MRDLNAGVGTNGEKAGEMKEPPCVTLFTHLQNEQRSGCETHIITGSVMCLLSLEPRSAVLYSLNRDLDNFLLYLMLLSLLNMSMIDEFYEKELTRQRTILSRARSIKGFNPALRNAQINL